jgi:hypothetical protein
MVSRPKKKKSQAWALLQRWSLAQARFHFQKKKKPLNSNFGAKLKLGSTIFGKKKGQALTWF